MAQGAPRAKGEAMMITASEARTQRLTTNQRADNHMPYIERRIKKAISENERSTTIGLYDDKDLVNAIACKLIFLGYYIDDEYSFDHHGWYIHISW